jgi:LysR family glycine cleavage system transcriptional activator
MYEHFSRRHAGVSPKARRLPSFPALAAFEAVARHSSFAKAADELNITQSAVSHRVTSLEQQFEARFFVRSSRGVALTAEGRLFLDAVVDAFSTLEEACTRLAVRRKVVRVSVGPAFARAWLVGPLGDFSREHADIDVEVNATKLAAATKLACLKTGEADISIRYGTSNEWPGFESLQLTRTWLFPVCSPDYRAALGGCADPLVLLQARLLRSPSQPWSPWFAANGVQAAEPAQGPQFSDAALMLDAAARGQGVALARSTLVEQHLRTGRLVRLFENRLLSDRSYHAIYAPSVAQRPEVGAFIDWISRQAQAPPSHTAAPSTRG